MEVVENIRLWDRLLLLSIEAYFSSPAGIFQEYLGFPMFEIELWILSLLKHEYLVIDILIGSGAFTMMK